MPSTITGPLQRSAPDTCRRMTPAPAGWPGGGTPRTTALRRSHRHDRPGPRAAREQRGVPHVCAGALRACSRLPAHVLPGRCRCREGEAVRVDGRAVAVGAPGVRSEGTSRAGARRSRRTMVEAILRLARTGCQWRELPARFGPWPAVWAQWRRWRDKGVWAQAMTRLRRVARVAAGRDPDPGLLMVDAQIVKGRRAGLPRVRGPRRADTRHEMHSGRRLPRPARRRCRHVGAAS